MNILVLIGRLPYPLDSGAKIRTFNLLSRLAERHSITLVSFSFGPEDVQNAKALKPIFKEIITVPHHSSGSSLGKIGFALKNLASTMPYSIDKYTSRAISTTIHKLLKEQHFDIIHCDSLQVSHNVTSINGIPKVLTEHNVESLIWKRAVANERNPVKRLYLSIQAKRLELYEASACKAFDFCIAVSEVDRLQIEKLSGNNRCVVVPNGVDCEFFKPQAIQPEPCRLVFTGLMDWLPNEDAMVYFVEEMLPLIRKAIPNAHLYIVGRNPTARVRQLAHQGSGVEVTGSVDDIRPFIAQAAVYVTPLRFGSGTRLKILEAMAMGRPVVSTRVGCEGLDVTHGKNILVADEPRQFAERVVDTINDSLLATSLGEAGRALVEREYDWPHIADALEEVWYRSAKR